MPGFAVSLSENLGTFLNIKSCSGDNGIGVSDFMSKENTKTTIGAGKAVKERLFTACSYSFVILNGCNTYGLGCNSAVGVQWRKVVDRQRERVPEH